MITLSVEQQSRTVCAKGAILLYGPTGRQFDHNAAPEHLLFATMHKIEEIGDAPQIMPGRPITEHDLVTIHKGLTTQHASQSITWIDQQLLAKGPNRMVWWTPPKTRPLFFKKSSHNKGTFDGSAVCAIPGMVWMAIGSSLYVFATKESSRPTPETELYQAPFFNVWGRGLVCSGNANRPSSENQWVPQAWETYFFGSHFTHPNFAQKDRLVKGVSPTNFWKAMVKEPVDAFPLARLVKVPLVTGDLIDPLIVDALNKWPRPKGEF